MSVGMFCFLWTPAHVKRLAEMPFAVFQSLSCLRLFQTPWMVAHQASLSTGFPRHEYWSGLPCSP